MSVPYSSAQAQESADQADSNEKVKSDAQSTVGDAAKDVEAVELAQAETTQEASEEVAQAEPAQGGNVEELLITGSRIKRKSIATAAPITVVSKEDLLASGRTTIAEILQRLPVNSGAINIQVNNGGTGASTINLRGLGAARTLVLVNGRRFVPGGQGANAAVDLNSIPVSIIERVELLKDGASAIYGSDAISGVVNIITRRDFEGVEANAYSALSQRGDGRIYQIDATAGASSEKGNVVFSALFLDQQPTFAGDRDFSDTPRSFNFGDWDDAGRPDDFEPFINPFGGNSSAPPQGNIIDRSNEPGNAAWDATGCAGGACFNDPVTGWDQPLNTYNFQPENYVLTPSRRMSLYAQGQYDVSEYFGVFFESSFTNRASEQLLAPTPLFTITEGLTVSAENRFNPFGRDFTDVRRRLIEVGNRVFSQDSNTFRVVFGAQGRLPDVGPLYDWRWDAYGNFGRTETTNEIGGRLNSTRFQNAIGPDSGCTGACVPLDLFSGQGGITQDMIDYLTFTGVERGFTEQNVIAANIGGPLFEIVEGDPVALAFGYEFRRELGANVPNPLAVSGEATGNSREIIEGSFEVHAGYAELSVPLVRNVPGFHALELNAAGRFVDFNTFGSNFSGKVGIRWNPIEYIGLRGTYSTAFRAPNISNLFSGRADSFPALTDPCSSVTGVGSLQNPTVAANCQADGFPDGVLDPNTQLRTQVGGNPDLDPETATIITGGIVLEDTFIKGLTASLDYYNIDIDDAISTIGSDVILASCYESADRQFCELIQRGSSGTIENIIDTLTNVGGFKASGLDFDIRYQSPNTDFGRFGIGLEGVVLFEFEQILASGFAQSFVGNFDAGFSNQDYRLNWYMRWAMDFLNAGMNFRFLPGIVECGREGSDQPCNSERAPGVEAPVERPVDSYFYMDIFAGVDVETPLGRTNVTVGINNLTDAEPPFIASGFIAETDALAFDLIGRSFYARISQRF